MNILGLIPLAIFVLCCALIVWVLAQLARQGDERRKMIVGQSMRQHLSGDGGLFDRLRGGGYGGPRAGDGRVFDALRALPGLFGAAFALQKKVWRLK